MTYEELENKMDEYEDAFDEQFPLMCCRGMSEESIAKAIDECLNSGKPYKPLEDAEY